MYRNLALRRLTPVALVAASTLLLASCGSSDKPSADKPSSSPSASATPGCGEIAAGDTSDSVKVTGDFGKTQTAEFGTPLKATDLERTVVTTGTGAKTEAGQTVDALISVYLGKDGKSLGAQPVTLPVADATLIPAFSAGVDCVPIGSRIVVTAPAKDMYGAEGNPNLGVTAEDSLVIVTDVIGLKKQLVPQAWKVDPPTVKFAAGGKPTLKLPDTVPPSELLLKVLRKGDGAVVKSGDTVTLDYQGTSWDTGKIFDQSYGKQPASFKTTGVVEGFGAALVGQKVGTRLVVSIPPKYAYGDKGSGNTNELAGQTLVFVIEIQKTAAS
jgi:FKBP-type peptidyl-prolyl cis-trans isomerase